MWIFWRILGTVRVLFKCIFAEQIVFEGNRCPLCDYEFDVYEGGEVIDSGDVAGTPNLPKGFWVETLQTCPRCHHRFHVQDSAP